MSERKYQIDPERKSDVRTICEVHRELHRLLEPAMIIDGSKQPALDLIAEAYDMAKRMAKRLEEYNGKHGQDFLRDVYRDD